MKNLFLRFSITLALLGWATNAIGQSFSSMYQFINVTTTSGTTDPTAVPTATGLTFGSFSSAGVGTNPNAGGVFSFTGWTTGATTGSDTFTGSIDLTDYYSVTLTPNVGCSIDINSLVFSSRRSTTGPRQFVVRSSLDSYATNLPATGGTNVTVVPTNVFQMPDGSATTTYPNNTVTLGTSFDAITSAITFRVYAFNAEASGGSFGIDDFQINGVASCGPTCSITNIALSDIQPCNDNFTPAPTTSDDFYTADITVTFANQPATGDLELSSSSNDLTQGTVVVPVSSLSGTTYTFDNVEIYADGAVSSLQDIVTRQTELATQAANGVYSTKQRSALDNEFQALAAEYDRIVHSVSYNGTKLLDQTFGTSSVQAGYSSIQFSLGDELAQTAGDGTFQAAVSFAGGFATVSALKIADFNQDG
ncbi:MAG TPA: hypothetical protein PKH93_05940, partial [Chitinophagales bacterium]|nr:hypothetical protein [Chitinophagales bacterium]